MPMWPRFGINTSGSYDDPVLECKNPLYGRDVRIGPERISIDHLFAIPRGADDTRFSIFNPFFKGIVEFEETLWVVFELLEEGPRMITPRCARPITVEEHEALHAHLRKHGSLAFSAKRRDHLLAQVELYWEAACAQLEGKIPAGLRSLALMEGWLREEGGLWRLPAFLANVWNETKTRDAYTVVYQNDFLSVCGLQAAGKAEHALRELAEAWNGHVNVVWSQNAEGIQVSYTVYDSLSSP